MRDDDNLWGLAIAAASLGRFDEAERLIPRALQFQPYLAAQAVQLRAEIARLRETERD